MNSTSTGFTAQNATATEPSGTGIFDLGAEPHGSRNKVPTWLQLMPFGKNGNDDTFDFRLYGYSETVPADLVTDTKLYIPQLLVDVSVVLCALTFSDHAADTFLADTLTINDGPTDLDGAFENSPWLSVLSPAEDLPASVLVHTRGCRYIKFDWDLAGGQEAVSMNCLWRPVDDVS